MKWLSRERGAADRTVSAAPIVQLWGAKAAAVGLWVLVGAGALGGCAAFVVRPLASPTNAAKVTAPASSTGAEGFAELFVASYLSEAGGSDKPNDVVKTFYPGGDVDLHDVKPGSLYVTQTVALDATELSKGYWSVTVGARVMAASATGYVPLGLRAYQVGVARSPDGAFVATSVPGQVALPRTASLPKLKGPELGMPDLTHGDVNAALQRFFAAYLTGQGELSRYASPDAGVVAVTPAPYSGIALQRVSLSSAAIATSAGAQSSGTSGTSGYVARVVVAAVDNGGRTQVFAYSVELAQQEGRWEVHKLLPAAPLAAGASAAAASPTTSTTTFFSSDATPTTPTTAPTPDTTATTDTTPSNDTPPTTAAADPTSTTTP